MKRVRLACLVIAAAPLLAVQPVQAWRVVTDRVVAGKGFAAIRNAKIASWTPRDGLSYAVGQKKKTLATASVVQVRRASARRPAAFAGRWELLLRNGDRLFGHPVPAAGQNMVFRTAFGNVSAPLLQVAGIRKSKAIAIAGAADHDTVYLANGDKLNGVFNGLTAQGLAFSSKLGNIHLPLARVKALALGGALVAPRTKGLRFKVGFVDGGRLTTPRIAWKNQTLRVADPAGKFVAAPLAQVRQITVLGGAVRYLADKTPTSVHQESYFGSLHWPVRANRNVLGRPLMVNGKHYRWGIGVHADIRLSYRWKGQYTHLLLLPAMDDSAAPYGQARVAVAIGGKQVYTAMLQAHQPAKPLLLPLGGAHSLTLTATARRRMQVRGRVDFIYAALLR